MGSDSNPGTDSSPWKTPKHAVDCGDVVIAAAGAYGGTTSPFGTNDWGTVSNCPSTAGGIDGTGGVYFATLLCAGPDLGSCAVSASSEEAFRVDASNWAVEGFTATSGAQACFAATSETTTTLHQVRVLLSRGATGPTSTVPHRMARSSPARLGLPTLGSPKLRSTTIASLVAARRTALTSLSR